MLKTVVLLRFFVETVIHFSQDIDYIIVNMPKK